MTNLIFAIAVLLIATNSYGTPNLEKISLIVNQRDQATSCKKGEAHLNQISFAMIQCRSQHHLEYFIPSIVESFGDNFIVVSNSNSLANSYQVLSKKLDSLAGAITISEETVSKGTLIYISRSLPLIQVAQNTPRDVPKLFQNQSTLNVYLSGFYQFGGVKTSVSYAQIISDLESYRSFVLKKMAQLEYLPAGNSFPLSDFHSRSDQVLHFSNSNKMTSISLNSLDGHQTAISFIETERND